MPISISISAPIPLKGKNRPHSLIREPTFYQEAYVASFPYIQAIGNQLVRECGFRLVQQGDVARYSPFLIDDNDDLLLLNLISTSSPVHIIQLPELFTSLISTPETHIRLSTFSTVLTSCYIHITESTHSIGPLSDLISFLQCLLPSSNALSLSPTSPTSKSNSFDKSFDNIKKSHTTVVKRADQVLNEGEDEDEKEKEKLHKVDSWDKRFKSSFLIGSQLLPPNGSTPMKIC
ncbi:uncharacterized protein IL334_001170 [Kwoniella shivajii]|uniref:Uncharacterized protein n=1 Tax=Kwoniella shivajii TaxID=564305 RepID=A0ABZ1CR67_9TREE|nr:hypothetical protein IL334_001170 [Kwoniella shivajii]